MSVPVLSPPQKIKGWKNIARHLDVSVSCAKRFFKLPVDPLPVRKGHDGWYIYDSAADSWVNRHDMAGQVWEELRSLRRIVRQMKGEYRSRKGHSARPHRRPRATPSTGGSGKPLSP